LKQKIRKIKGNWTAPSINDIEIYFNSSIIDVETDFLKSYIKKNYKNKKEKKELKN